MSELVFYTNPQSRGRMVRWMLEETGEPYETRIIEYGEQMKSAPYTDINPMGKVPSIVHQGRVVTECPAIIAYLADAFPGTRLAPALSERHSYYRWLFFAAGPLEAAITNNFLKVEIGPEQTAMVGYGKFELAVSTLAAALELSAYICGDKFTAADVYIGSHVRWGLEFGTMPEHTAFREYYDRIRQRPAFIRANNIDDALIAERKSKAD